MYEEAQYWWRQAGMLVMRGLQAVLQGGVSAAAARSLESGAIFERWIKTGQWMDAGRGVPEDAAPGGGGGCAPQRGVEEALTLVPAETSAAKRMCARQLCAL